MTDLTNAPTVTETMQGLLDQAKTREGEALSDITAALKVYANAERDLDDKLQKARVSRDGQLKHSRARRDAAREDIRHLSKAIPRERQPEATPAPDAAPTE